jgi:uncharacterized protein (TIGR00299 family) protein
MKVAYFDCFSGISGNMILGALIDLGIDAEDLDHELGKLPLQYRLEVKRVEKRGISAIHVDVLTQEVESKRTLKDALAIIEQSKLDDDIKRQSKQIFTRLGEAEAKVHNQALNEVHFHEIGAVDTFIDIVGAVIGMKMMGIEMIYCSPINVGRGYVKCAHGVLPVPAPVTVELLKGAPVYNNDIEGELTTPTGAAIITSIAADFGDLPPLTIENTGYGAGSMELEIPNLMRLWVGETEKQSGDYINETVTVIETTIDDMNPQLYDHIMERLLHAGALDVFLTPVQMKKNRPGIVLSIITSSELVENLLGILFEESTTLGVRVSETRRLSLPRSIHSVKTKFGEIRIKVAHKGDIIVNVAPEYDDCQKAAMAHQVAINQVYTEVQRAWKRRK